MKKKDVALTVMLCAPKDTASTCSKSGHIRGCERARFGAGGVETPSELLAASPEARFPASSRAPLISTSFRKLPTAPWDGTFMFAPTASFRGSIPWERTAKASWKLLRNSSLAGAYALIMIILLLALPVHSQTRTERIRVGIPSPNIGLLPLMIAQTNGFFKAEGLDVELVMISPPVDIQALIAGEIDLATSFFSVVRANIAGIRLPTVMIIQTATDHVLLGRPEIRSGTELKGKTVAVAALRSLSDVLARRILANYGLLPDVDVKIFPVGGGSALMLQALQGSRAHAAMLASPHSKVALMQGFRRLISASDVTPIPLVGLSTTAHVMQQKSKAIVSTIRATLKGIRFIKENKAEVVKIMPKELGIKDKQVVELVYDDAIRLYSETGIVSDDALALTVAVAKEVQGAAKEVLISDLVEWSFAREALRGLGR